MIYRLKEGKIIYDLIEPSEDKNLKKGVIVFSGLPNEPKNVYYGENLAAEGYYVLQPRYIGNWESYGQFSIKNCLKTITESEKFLLKGEAIECFNNKKIKWKIDETFIIGTSFAPSLILSLLKKLKTRNIICIAPLIDLENHNKNPKLPEENLYHLYDFLKRGFENAFRGFSRNDWEEFLHGKSSANPMKFYKDAKDKNILLIHGDNDQTIHYSKTENYFNKIRTISNAELKIYPGLGHGKQIKKNSYDYVLNWMQKN